MIFTDIIFSMVSFARSCSVHSIVQTFKLGKYLTMTAYEEKLNKIIKEMPVAP